jgi:lactate dehydrogenase-like 2-hydroxyacid dehydrogenase
VIDEEALVRAMKNDRISRVGLDVFENEPEVHPYLVTSERATLLPVSYR